jgi:hypothetical protein
MNIERLWKKRKIRATGDYKKDAQYDVCHAD